MATLAVFEPPFAQYFTDSGDLGTAPAEAGRITNSFYTDDGTVPDRGDHTTQFLYQGAYEADGHIFHVWENDNWGEAWIKSYTAPADSSGYPANYLRDRPDLDPNLPNPSEAAAAAAQAAADAQAAQDAADAQAARDAADAQAAQDAADAAAAQAAAQAAADAKAATDKTGLFNAAKSGDADEITRLLDDGADPDVLAANGDAPLYFAVLRGHEEAVRALLDGGADVNLSDPSGGYTALHYAAHFNQAGMVPILVAAGADLDAKSTAGQTAEALATARGKTDAAEALSEAKTAADAAAQAAADAAAQAAADTALHDAADQGDAQAIDTQLKAGADIDAQDEDGKTALHFAAAAGHANAVTALLDAGADIAVKDVDGQTALHDAAYAGYPATVTALVTGGADIAAQDDTGNTPLHLAAFAGETEVVTALLAGGADIAAQNADGNTAQQLAADGSFAATVTVLQAAADAAAAAAEPVVEEPVDPSATVETFDGPYARYDLINDGELTGTGGAGTTIAGQHTGDGSDPGDTISSFYLYQGAYKEGEHIFHVWENSDAKIVTSATAAESDFPGSRADIPDLDPNLPAPCFMAGTEIATPAGICLVEDLKIGDPILTASGKVIAVKWIGRSSYYPRLHRDPRIEPVCIRAGALGNGLPHSDLTVTADHGMILDGMVIHASALVNGSDIAFVPLADLPDRVTYYHIETEAHEAILANGAAAETFVDVLTRAAFDNYAEYIDLYGVDRMIPEMDRLRVTAHRLLTAQARQQLGIAAPAPATATETPEVPETLQDAE